MALFKSLLLERSLVMFRKLLFTSVGVYAALCVAWLPGQALAQHGRSHMRPGMVRPTFQFVPPIDRRFVDPRFNRSNRLLLESELGVFGPTIQRRALNAAFETAVDRRVRENLLLQMNPAALRRRFIMTPLIGF
jgi:hypothetical protein